MSTNQIGRGRCSYEAVNECEGEVRMVHLWLLPEFDFGLHTWFEVVGIQLVDFYAIAHVIGCSG